MNNEMIWKVANLGVGITEFVKILAVLGIIERRDGVAAVYFKPGSEHDIAAFWNVVRIKYGFEVEVEQTEKGFKVEIV